MSRNCCLYLCQILTDVQIHLLTDLADNFQQNYHVFKLMITEIVSNEKILNSITDSIAKERV